MSDFAPATGAKAGQALPKTLNAVLAMTDVSGPLQLGKPKEMFVLSALKKYGSKARLIVVIMSSATPFLIIGGLLYAGLFVKADAMVTKVAPRAIERRDNFFGVSVPSVDVIWAAGTSGKVVRSDDRGLSWAQQPTPTNGNLQGIAAWDAERAVAVGNGGVIIVTSDGGKNWTQAKVLGLTNASKLLRVRIFGDTAWAMGEFGALFSSADHGASWARALPEKDLAWNDIEFVGNRGWLVGEFGTVMKTTDSGVTWTQVSTANKISLMSAAFRDPQNGVAVGLSGTVMVTDDGGNTWKQMAKATKEHLYSVIWDANRWLAVGDKGVMLTAEANGASWEGGRISEKDYSWRTQIVRSGPRHYLAGARLGILEGDKLTVVGQLQI